MPEDAVLEAPAVDIEIPSEGISEPSDGGQGDRGEEQETGTGEQPTGAPARAVTADGKNLTPEAKAVIEEIKAKNPALAKSIRDAIFDQARIRAALPGGLREVQELRQTLESVGGKEGIEQAQGELQGWNDFDAKFTAGDPAAIDFIMETPEGKDAFMRMAPIAFNRFAAENPEGYAAYVSQAIHADVVRNGLPTALQMMQYCLSKGDVEGASQEFGKVSGWFQGLQEMSQKSVQMPKREVANDQVTELQGRADQAERTTWRMETAQQSNSTFSQEWNRLSAGRKLSGTQGEAIRELFESRMGKAIKQHEPKLNGYFTTRDKQGFLKYAASIDKTEIPKALRAAFDAVVPARPGPKTTAGANGKPANGAPVKAAPGFQVIGERPKSDQIKWADSFNTQSNIKAGRAVLTDGRRVQWSR